jgi:hypothetical protein
LSWVSVSAPRLKSMVACVAVAIPTPFVAQI